MDMEHTVRTRAFIRRLKKHVQACIDAVPAYPDTGTQDFLEMLSLYEARSVLNGQYSSLMAELSQDERLSLNAREGA